MLDELQTPVLPSSTDSLAWSSDGELAVAGNSYVYLFVFISSCYC